jgi:hypothetical protein
MYSYITYDYDYYNDTDTTADNITIYDDITYSDDITIVCKDDHTMTKITKECPDGMSQQYTCICVLLNKLVSKKVFYFNFLP